METGQELDLATNDLGPLAWVLDELRKSLDAASSALRSLETITRGQPAKAATVTPINASSAENGVCPFR